MALSVVLALLISCSGSPYVNPPVETGLDSEGKTAMLTNAPETPTAQSAGLASTTNEATTPAPTEKPKDSADKVNSAANRQAPMIYTAQTAQAVAATEAAPPKHVVIGYYVPYDSTSWQTLQVQADALDFVATQSVSVDACGSIGSETDSDLVAFARSKGIGVLPSLLTGDQALNHRLLTDERARSRTLSEIVDYVVGEDYAGFDLDLENIADGDRAAYTAFVAKLSAALHEHGKLLMAALPAKFYDAKTGWAGPYDYAAVGPYLDYAMIMTYAYTAATSKPGSTAPYTWVDQVMAYVTSQIPSNKVLLGLAFYGYDWNVTSGGRAMALRYPQAAEIAGRHAASIDLDANTRSGTFTYMAKRGEIIRAASAPALNHRIVTRQRPPCDRPLPSAPPAPSPTPLPSVPPSQEQKHVVWLETAASTAARLAIADAYRVGGVGAWRLGQEDPGVWPILKQWRAP